MMGAKLLRLSSGTGVAASVSRLAVVVALVWAARG